MEICPKCGLPKQACVCEQIVKSSQKIQVTTDKKKYGKIVTIITGFEGVDVKKTAKALKNELLMQHKQLLLIVQKMPMTKVWKK